jgi:hypothetical protein
VSCPDATPAAPAVKPIAASNSIAENGILIRATRSTDDHLTRNTVSAQ